MVPRFTEWIGAKYNLSEMPVIKYSEDITDKICLYIVQYNSITRSSQPISKKTSFLTWAREIHTHLHFQKTTHM